MSDLERKIAFRRKATETGLMLEYRLSDDLRRLLAKAGVSYHIFGLSSGSVEMLNATPARVHRLLRMAKEMVAEEELTELCSLKATVDDADSTPCVWRSDWPTRKYVTVVEWLAQQGEDMSGVLPVE